MRHRSTAATLSARFASAPTRRRSTTTWRAACGMRAHGSSGLKLGWLSGSGGEVQPRNGFCESPAEFDKSAALAELGRNAARMQTRRGYTCAFEPPRQFAREQDVAQLGAAIRLDHRPPARARHRREVNAAAAMRPRGDRDHA